MTKKSLKGGTSNLLYGRDNELVKREVEALLAKHSLDFLNVQEANEYVRVLHSIKGFDYYPAGNTGILVKTSVGSDKFKRLVYGDGWTTVRGGHHAPADMAQVRIGGWLVNRSVHLPTPSTWVNGRLVSPDERRDDYVAGAKGLLRYFRWPCTKNGRIAAGDWNENPETMGEYSPAWIAKKRGAKTWAPTAMAGHGRIDWVMGKGVIVTRVFKDLNIKERSDHEPVIFTVVKT